MHRQQMYHPSNTVVVVVVFCLPCLHSTFQYIALFLLLNNYQTERFDNFLCAQNPFTGHMMNNDTLICLSEI